jgi:hypothetical protein
MTREAAAETVVAFHAHISAKILRNFGGKPVNKHYRCSICQKPTERMICASCKTQWGSESSWVKDLMLQEHRWRMVNRHEARLSPIHISVEGYCYRANKRISNRYLYNQSNQENDIDHAEALEDLERLTETAGLTPREQLTYHLMLAGFTDDEGAAMINELEYKAITASAYRGRLEKVLKKIHSVMDIHWHGA